MGLWGLDCWNGQEQRKAPRSGPAPPSLPSRASSALGLRSWTLGPWDLSPTQTQGHAAPPPQAPERGQDVGGTLWEPHGGGKCVGQHPVSGPQRAPRAPGGRGGLWMRAARRGEPPGGTLGHQSLPRDLSLGPQATRGDCVSPPIRDLWAGCWPCRRRCRLPTPPRAGRGPCSSLSHIPQSARGRATPST